MSEPNIDRKHNQSEELSFDPEVLAEKYLLERDKRLREDGNDQYIEVKGEFSYFVEDPYVTEEIDREPVEDEVEVIIVGGGFGGMLAAARLREAGIEDFRIMKKEEILVVHGME
jgi:Predicted flavoprotein involved in K+ transport